MPAPFARTLVMDSDAAAYCARSGATDRAAINAFVRGVKSLGLWNSMVCWPLRSTQNAGTGTTAYSLGGLGTYNGTLTNGPTWGSDGVNFADNTTQHISTQLTPDTANNFLIWAAMQCNAQGTAVNGVCGSRGGDLAVSYFSCFQNTTGGFNAVLWSTTSAFATRTAIEDGSYNTAQYRFDVTSSPFLSGITVNAESETTGTTTGPLGTPPPNLHIGTEQNNGANSRSLNGNLPFLAYIRANSINNVALRDLYKQTLGAGLGLP